MKFVNIRLLTGDIAASLNFWRDIVGLEASYADESIGYAYFDTGNGGIELMSRAGFAESLGEMAATSTPNGRLAVLVFQVDDVDAEYARLLERGARAVAGPQDRPAWQARSAQVADPDGYILELYSPLKTNA